MSVQIFFICTNVQRGTFVLVSIWSLERLSVLLSALACRQTQLLVFLYGSVADGWSVSWCWVRRGPGTVIPTLEIAALVYAMAILSNTH